MTKNKKALRSRRAGSKFNLNAVVLRSSENKPKAQKGRTKSRGKQGGPPHGAVSKSARRVEVKQNWGFWCQKHAGNRAVDIGCMCTMT